MRRWIPFWLFLLCCFAPRAASAAAVDARFDLIGPKIDVRVTRGAGPSQQTLPIASVPNLQPGDRLWIHPDLPPSQSVKYLLICAFLRGTTNPPPENWFTRVETWKKEVREEGVFLTVPEEAQQVVLFMAPETGGDFSTLKSAVRGRPGVFVRASQDLNEAGFEQARIERYLADIRRVSATDPAELQKRSDLLSRTLALKPNADCFRRPSDVQFTCLTQSGSQTLLDDGHGQNIASALSNGPTSDLIQATSYTAIAGAGLYSAYVGAVVDLIRLMGNLHTAQYQYIPAIAFPQGDALNLRLNTPPSFHNPKSVLVIGLPSVQTAEKPPLRPAHANETACLLKPKVVLPIEGAPLVFSTDFATGLTLHINVPPGTPAEPDIPLVADAFEGGFVLQRTAEHHVPLRNGPRSLNSAVAGGQQQNKPQPAPGPAAETAPRVTGTIQGHWGFDTFAGPTIPLQMEPGEGWHIVNGDGSSSDVIAGKAVRWRLTSTGSACVHTINAGFSGGADSLPLRFKQSPDDNDVLEVSAPENRRIAAGNLRIEIQQYGQPKPDEVAAQTFTEPPQIAAAVLPAGDKSLLLTGTHLESIDRVALGDLVFRPAKLHDVSLAEEGSEPTRSLRLKLADDAANPPTHAGDKLSAQLVLDDGRHLPLSLTVLPARPALSLLSRNFDPVPGATIALSSPDDLPLSAHLAFTVKSRSEFPRNGQIEVETSDGTLRTVLTLAPSGGLVLQDPHTIVANLDPLRSFGPSAFGALRLRAVFPANATKTKHGDGDGGSAPSHDGPDSQTVLASVPEDTSRVSDWMPLATLVRLPALTHLQCGPEATASCTLTGSNLFLIQSVSADPAFETADPVPDGFTGTTLPVPHPAGSSGTLFVKLRDDPAAINAAIPPASSTTNQASTVRGHGSTTTVRN